MKIRGLGRLRRAVGRFKNKFTPGVLILLYHRVAELPSDPYVLSVTPQDFAQHLEVLRQYGVVMQLQQLIQALRDGNLPHRAVVVTFDDGYADNLYNAKPLLERYDIPATVFVTSGHIGKEREFWWDELDRLLLQPGTLPETLMLNVNGTMHQWELDAASDYTQDDQRRHSNWHLYQPDDPSPRHRLFRCLHQLLGSLPQTQRSQVLDKLSTWAGASIIGRPTHRTLSANELSRLAEDKLVEIGAHTVTHPILSSLPVAAQRQEIQHSKGDLEEILGYSVTSFAYPHGNYTDYSNETVSVAAAAGFTCACTTNVDLVRGDTNHFQLPRLTVVTQSGEMFARQLEEWLYA